MATILVLGKGLFGARLAAGIEGAVHGAVDITDRDAVRALLARERPEAVINAAGRTGTPNVDWCESHQTETYRANVIGALNVADACETVGAYLLHLGSGCVFYGPSPSPHGWREDDFANPSAFYSRTKYAADLVLSRLAWVGVARLRMPVDHTPGPRNLITKLVSYKQIIDVQNSVTVVDDFVAVARQLIAQRAPGIFHVTNPGVMRHRELVDLYRELVDAEHACEFIDDGALVERGLAVRARSNCVLASSRLAQLGITMPPIDVALRDCMLRYAKALRDAR